MGRSSRLQARLSRALTYALWSAVGLAVVLGLVNCAGLRTGPPPPAPPPAAPQLVPPPGGCAELVVAAWLAGDREALAGLPGDELAEPEPGRHRAAHTYTAAVTPGEGAWRFLVAAQVQRSRDVADPADPAGTPDPGTPDPGVATEPGVGGDRGTAGEVEGRWRPAGTWYLTVTLVPSAHGDGCGGWVAAALPARVPAPALAGEPGGAYPVALEVAGTDLAETVAAYLAGTLAGGELGRYAAPGARPPVLSPAPYAQVSLVGLRAVRQPADGAAVPPDGTVLRLLATVTVHEDDLPLVYPMTAGVRGGRWEILAVDPLVGSTPLDVAASPSVSGG